jgi:MFS family permease
MPALTPSHLFIGSGLVWNIAIRSWWIAFVIFTVIDLQMTPLQLVLLGTALEATVLVAEIPTGIIADLYSRKWSVVIAYLMVGIGVAASGLFTSFWPLIATQVFWGLGYTFRSGSETAWITSEIGVEATESLLIRRGKLALVASSVGLGLGAVLGSVVSVRAVIVSSGAMLFLWGLVLARTMTEHAFAHERTTSWRSFLSTMRQGATQTWQKMPLRILVLVMLLVGISSEGIDRLGVRRLDEVGFAERTNEIVVLAIMAAIAALLGAFLLWLLEDRVSGRSIATALFILLGFTALWVGAVAWAVSLPLAIGALTIRDGTISAADPLIAAWANAHSDDQYRATTHSFVGQAEAIGEMTGGIMLGFVATTTDVATAIACSALLLFGAAALAVRGRMAWSLT